MPTSVIYTRIGEQRGKPRLWLEGPKLSRAGIAPGQHFTLTAIQTPAGNGLALRFEQGGPRVVSRKRRGDDELPVIDISNEDLRRILGGAERVRVVVRPGVIEVTVHHHARAETERAERLARKLVTGEPLAIGSLCHGGGVLDSALHAGLARAGIASRLGFANEMEAEYLDSSLRNSGLWDLESVAVLGPMQDVEWRKLPPVEILVAGLPCTGASLSGRAKNKLAAAEEHPAAGALFVAFLAAIQTLRPAVVVLENVVPYQTTTSMTVIRAVLDGLGYELAETVLDGADFGAIEKRERMCMVATTRGLGFAFDGIEALHSTAPPRQLQEILEPIADDDPMWKCYDYLAAKEQRDIAAGKGFRRQLVDGSATRVGTIGRGYMRVRSTEVQLRHPSNPNLSRLLTPAEHARVKTIPESLIEGLAATRAHEVLGQSVIWAAFAAVGELLGQALRATHPMPAAMAA